MGHSNQVQYILFTKDYFPYHYGGMANYYRGYADGFGDELHVLIPGGATILPDGDVDDRVKQIHASSKKPSTLVHRVSAYKSAARLIESFEGKTIILCGNFRPYIDVCWWLKKKYGVFVFAFFHGNDLLRVMKRFANNPFKRMKYHILFNTCDGFVANSRYTMSLIPDSYKEKKHLIIAPPGIGKAYVNQSLHEPVFGGEFDVQLMTVCRLDDRKGVYRVLESVKILKERGISCFYNVVGKGDLHRYNALAESLGISDRVAFHGYMKDDETISMLKTSDIFVMPSSVAVEKSDVEGFGIVYLEANAVGKPVIGSHTGGIPDAVEDGMSGLLVQNPEDASEIADKIEFLYRNKRKAVELGRYGHQRVNRDYRYLCLAEKLKCQIIKSFRKS